MVFSFLVCMLQTSIGALLLRSLSTIAFCFTISDNFRSRQGCKIGYSLRLQSDPWTVKVLRLILRDPTGKLPKLSLGQN